MAMNGCSVSYLFKRLILHRPDKDEDEQPESQLKKLEGDLKTGRISGEENLGKAETNPDIEDLQRGATPPWRSNVMFNKSPSSCLLC